MAAGDITYDSQANGSSGNFATLSGSIEVDNTARAFAVCGGHIVNAVLNDQDGVGTAQCTMNSNNGTVDSSKGSLYVDGSLSGPNTYKFTVFYLP